MNWRERYNFPKTLINGMKFTLNPNSDKSGWDEGINNGAKYNKIFIIKKCTDRTGWVDLYDIYGDPHNWTMDYPFLKEHFIYAGKK